MGAALTAFAVVFVAELGDRTQLLLASLASRHRVGPVAGGLLLGYGLTGLVAVVVGGLLGAALPERTVAVASGLLFLGFAAWALRAEDGDEEDEEGAAEANDERRGAVLLTLSVAGALVVSELGDKSMLSTATLAAERDPVAVWIGATLGIVASGGLGVVAGRLLADRLHPRWLRWASAALFTVFGVAQLARAAA